MPLNVRRFYTSIFFLLASFVVTASGQTVPPPQTNPQEQTAPVPTSGDIMRERISKAKAFIAVRNYNAAIYELENIRKESGDVAVQSVVNVLLMNSYLEQGDYKRAQDLLTEFFKQQKTTKPNAAANYMAVAGQVVKGARSRAERYRALGLSVSDRTLPLEALNDLEKMRETLEVVITQAKEIGGDKVRAADGMALLEEASNSRSMLARDDYDSRRWKDEVADTREQMASSRSVVMSAVNDVPNETETSTPRSTDGGVMQPVVDNRTAAIREREVKPIKTDTSGSTVAKSDTPVYIPSAPPTIKSEPKQADTARAADVKSSEAVTGSTIDVGSQLMAYATRQQKPVYPPAAKSVRATGTVKVEVTVNETGDVAEVHKTDGPMMLQSAAKDAIWRWKFKPFMRDGQPVKATGSVSFNFAL